MGGVWEEDGEFVIWRSRDRFASKDEAIRAMMAKEVESLKRRIVEIKLALGRLPKP